MPDDVPLARTPGRVSPVVAPAVGSTTGKWWASDVVWEVYYVFVAIATSSPALLDGLRAAGWTAAALTALGGLLALALPSPRSGAADQSPSDLEGVVR